MAQSIASGCSEQAQLLEQVRMFMLTRRYSLRTEQAYLDWRVKPLATR